MKKTSMVIAALSLAAVMPVLTVQSASAAHKATRDFCRLAVDAGGFDTMGACMSNFSGKDRNLKNICQILIDRDLLDIIEAKNRGQCLKILRDLTS